MSRPALQKQFHLSGFQYNIAAVDAVCKDLVE